ncbi:integrase [Ciceribacter naphthalenivorans]|uniref:Integrase n=2 Tax=Alphaproteobacteria TaxID=28211 RepID=A0A512HF40_9HYPH|nr:integrase [Ciceribacter naphthalenivorans]GLR21048.1 integrase [Ciceribacter naphthalenivorans]GLT03904.1 integrase [Sphingomonas psychrolutea]
MGLTLKHIVVTKAGTFHYRRRVPKDVATIIGKSEFKRLLGETEREALKNFPKINALYEQLVAGARAASPENDALTALEIRRLAELRATELAAMKVYVGGRELTGADPEAAEVIRDSALSKGVSDPVERQAVNLVANGGNLPRPVPTVEDAKRLYLAEKVKGDINERNRTLRLGRVMDILAHAVEASRPLDKLTREDAREVRDHMLRDLGMKPGTVKRYIADIRSMVNLGLRENDMSSVGNPFNGLTIRVETLVVDERHPIPEDMLPAIRETLSTNAGPDLWQLWRMLEGTGCRLAEVAALLVEDVKLDAPIPYLDVGFREHRRVKNQSSARRVPLVGDALEAAKDAVKAAGEGPYLFVQYAGVVKTKGGKGKGKKAATHASNALMKHVRKVTTSRKITVHSLRHTMEDRLIRARVEEFDRNLVLGHTKGGMSERYGGPDARLEAALKAVKAALSLNAGTISSEL